MLVPVRRCMPRSLLALCVRFAGPHQLPVRVVSGGAPPLCFRHHQPGRLVRELSRGAQRLAPCVEVGATLSQQPIPPTPLGPSGCLVSEPKQPLSRPQPHSSGAKLVEPSLQPTVGRHRLTPAKLAAALMSRPDS